MVRAVILACVAIVACDAPVREMRPVRRMAGALPITGIDVDGEGGLWIGYRLERGGGEGVDDVRVVHLDAEGHTLVEHVYTDLAAVPAGLAAGANAVWLHYGGYADAYRDHFVRELDPVTGAVRRQFDVVEHVIDLDVYGDELRLSTYRNEVIALDAHTLAERWRTSGFPKRGDQRGIASTSTDELYVVGLDDHIYRLDRQDGIVDIARHPLLDYHGWTVDVGMYLAWDGTHVIAAADGQITWLAPDDE